MLLSEEAQVIWASIYGFEPLCLSAFDQTKYAQTTAFLTNKANDAE